MSSRRPQQNECLLGICNSSCSENVHTSHLNVIIYLSIMADHLFECLKHFAESGPKGLVSSIRKYQKTASV